MGIEIRPAVAGDYEEAGRVTSLAYREFVRAEDSPAWEEYLAHIADVSGRVDRSLVLVAVEDGRILGSATLELRERIDDEDPPLAPDEAHIRMLGVHPDARRMGIARRLMERCFEEARGVGKTRVTLFTTGRMKVAQKMYEEMGFVRTSDRVFPDGFVLLGYERAIEAPPTR